jgi:hypothetical protein
MSNYALLPLQSYIALADQLSLAFPRPARGCCKYACSEGISDLFYFSIPFSHRSQNSVFELQISNSSCPCSSEIWPADPVHRLTPHAEMPGALQKATYLLDKEEAIGGRGVEISSWGRDLWRDYVVFLGYWQGRNRGRLNTWMTYWSLAGTHPYGA